MRWLQAHSPERAHENCGLEPEHDAAALKAQLALAVASRKPRMMRVGVLFSQDTHALSKAILVQLQRAMILAHGEQRVGNTAERLQRGRVLAAQGALAAGQALLVKRQRTFVVAFAAEHAGQVVKSFKCGWAVAA